MHINLKRIPKKERKEEAEPEQEVIDVVTKLARQEVMWLSEPPAIDGRSFVLKSHLPLWLFPEPVTKKKPGQISLISFAVML